ncbi:MAG: TetR/AcrR family transcriptional regulator [Pseudomonadota bacterium]
MAKTDTRAKIADVASRLFAKKGFGQTSTRDICKAAGISHGMLHYYFHDKETLLYQIMHKNLDEALERVREIIKSSKALKKKLEDVTAIYTRYMVVETDKMKVYLLEQRSLKPTHKKNLIKKEREFLHIVVDILDALKKQGKTIKEDSKACAFAYFWMVHGTYTWYDPKGTITPEKLAQIFNRIFTRGIYLK